MSKYIKKARNQLHSVREDVVRRQIQSAKGELRHKYPRPPSHGTSGFKFSDIDTDNMDTDRSQDDSHHNHFDDSHHVKCHLDAIQTSDYYSSHSSPEGSYVQDNQFVDHLQRKNTTLGETSSDNHSIEVNTDPFRLTSNEVTSLSSSKQQSSLFDDGPMLDEDYFGHVEKSDKLLDPLGLHIYSRNSPEALLFENNLPLPGTEGSSNHSDDSCLFPNENCHSSAYDRCGEFTDTIDILSGNENTFSETLHSDTNNLSFSDVDHQKTELENTHDSSPPTIFFPIIEVTDTKTQERIVSSDMETRSSNITKDEEAIHVHISPKEDLIFDDSVHDYFKDNEFEEKVFEKEETENQIEDQEREDVTEDELFMSARSNMMPSIEGSDDSMLFDKEPLSISEVEDHPLLSIVEDDYELNDHSIDIPVQDTPPQSHVLTTDHVDSSNIKSSEPQSSLLNNSSSLLHVTSETSKLSSGTKMKLNRSGKMVPVRPPRPGFSDKTRPRSAPDPDTVSLASTISSVSAYSVDEIIGHTDPSTTDNSSVSSISNPSIGVMGSDNSGLSRISETSITKDQSNTHFEHTIDQSEDYTLIILSFLWLLLYLYFSLNPFVYLAGFLAGFLVFYVTTGSAFVLYVQHSERERERRKAADKRTELPSLDELPKSIIVDFESSRELKSNKFGMVYNYHPTSHHPSQRIPAKVRLHSDFLLEIRYRKVVQTSDSFVTKEGVITKDIRNCSVLIVPEEVAQNRKRRWSKKFPLSISWSENTDTRRRVFLFPFTSREKEEWFRRLRCANEGKTYDDLIKDWKIYYRYMGKYMPQATSPSNVTRIHSKSHGKKHEHRPMHRPVNKHSHKQVSELVRFSIASDLTVDEDDTISISRQSNSREQNSTTTLNTTQLTTISQNETPVRPINSSLSANLAFGWINAGLARLAWDLWHEERWQKWVTSRIQRKLIRIKTPSFMEPLKVTDVDMGMDMPVLKRPFRLPKLDNQGVWVYLEVEYRGSFTMTIETKLKLEPKSFAGIMHFNTSNPSPQSHSPSPSPAPAPHTSEHPRRRSRILRLKVNNGDLEEDEISSGSDEESNNSLTKSLEEKLPVELEEQGIVIHPEDSLSSVSSTSSTLSSTSSTNTSSSASVVNENTSSPIQAPTGRKEKILNNMVSRLQKIAAKSRLIAKAAEKVSSYPLILSVEVKRLDGYLVVNMAPPPSDAFWYGFTQNPRLELVAKPKLGQREVTLSYVTDWIEKKLCELVEKKLVLPNMEDLVIPLLNSGLPEDKLENLTSPP